MICSNFKQIAFSCCLIFFLASCHSSKKTKIENQNIEISDGKNYVMTVILEFHNTKESPVKIYDIITSEGFLKDGNVNNVNPAERYLSVFDFKDDTPRIKITFPDPLNKFVEFVDKDGNLGKKEINLETEVVSLRVNYSREISVLKIYEREESTWKLIASFPLNQ